MSQVPPVPPSGPPPESVPVAAVVDEVPPRASGKATWAMILGLASLVCSVFAGIPAIVLGFMGLAEVSGSGGRLTGTGRAITGLVLGFATLLLGVPLLLIALLFPAIQAVREAARSNTSKMNMRNIGDAARIDSLDNAGRSPWSDITDDDGRPLLSWRVRLLPYLEEAALYDQFHLDEPWDSPHNRKLLDEMPLTYQSPGSRLKLQEGKTTYLSVRGPETVGDPAGRRAYERVPADTIVLVEVDDEHAVPWTKPEDWEYQPTDPTRGLLIRVGGFNAALRDGRSQTISAKTRRDELRRMFQVER